VNPRKFLPSEPGKAYNSRRTVAPSFLLLLILTDGHSGSVRNLEHFSSREVFVNMDKKFI
jgi:hypothetical protein